MSRVKLGDVAEEVRETYQGTMENPAIVGLEHLIPGEFRLKNWDSESDPNTTFTKAFHKGQVLFGRRRAYLKKAAVAPVDGVCSGDITVISAKQDKILPELLPFVIQNDDFFEYAVGNSAGSLSPRVKWDRLREYEFNLPDRDSQKKLATLLWNFVDTKEAYQDLIQQTDELVKSQFIEMFGDPFDNPNGYQLQPLSEVASIVSGITKGRKTKSNVLIQVPYMSTANVKDGHVDWSDVKKIEATPEEIQQYNLMPDDILMTEGGDPDKVGRGCMPGSTPVNCIYQNHIFRVRLNQSKVMAPYFARYITLPRVRAYFLQCSKQTTGIASINKKQLGELPVMFPDIDQQNEYIAFADQSDKSKFELNEAIKDLDAMYKRIVKENLG